jgi:hypothetical protein
MTSIKDRGIRLKTKPNWNAAVNVSVRSTSTSIIIIIFFFLLETVIFALL